MARRYEGAGSPDASTCSPRPSGPWTGSWPRPGQHGGLCVPGRGQELLAYERCLELPARRALAADNVLWSGLVLDRPADVPRAAGLQPAGGGGPAGAAACCPSATGSPSSSSADPTWTAAGPAAPRWLDGDPGGVPADTVSVAAALAAHAQVTGHWAPGAGLGGAPVRSSARTSASGSRRVHLTRFGDGRHRPGARRLATGELETRDLTRRVLLLATEGYDATSLGWPWTLPDVRWVVWARPTRRRGARSCGPPRGRGSPARRARPPRRGLAALPRARTSRRPRQPASGWQRASAPARRARDARGDRALDAGALAGTRAWLPSPRSSPAASLPRRRPRLGAARAFAPDAEDRARAAAAAAASGSVGVPRPRGCPPPGSGEPAQAPRGAYSGGHAHLAGRRSGSRAAVEAAAADFRAARAWSAGGARRWEGAGRPGQANRRGPSLLVGGPRLPASWITPPPPPPPCWAPSAGGARRRAPGRQRAARAGALPRPRAQRRRGRPLLARASTRPPPCPSPTGCPTPRPPVMQAWRHARCGGVPGSAGR